MLTKDKNSHMDLLEKALDIRKQLISWRRDFHAHPELGFKEFRTAEKIATMMESFGYRVNRGVGKTGIIADLGSGFPSIAIRADMDALPIQEKSDIEYISQNPGVMHACGHDAHMACALGAALLLTKEEFPGLIRFIFQPSEEVADDEGLSGAQRMITDGVLDGIKSIIALHVEGTTPVGFIRIESGPASGGVDSWFGEIIGQGGHGAHPHETIDPFFITAQVINALNGIVSRRIYPFHPAVISIGSIHGGFTENVIPDRVRITGTLRYTEKTVQKQIHTEIKRAFEVSQTLGGQYELIFEIGTPPMENHPEITKLISSVTRELIGKDRYYPGEKN
jgi:IAA-amino acid hydrolase